MSAVKATVERPFGWAPIDILNTWDLGTDNFHLPMADTYRLAWAAGWYLARDAPRVVDLYDGRWPLREPANAGNPGGSLCGARLPFGRRRVEVGDFGLRVHRIDNGLLVAEVSPHEMCSTVWAVESEMLDRLRAATARWEAAEAGFISVRRQVRDGVRYDETGRKELDDAYDEITDLAHQAWRSIDPDVEPEPDSAPRRRPEPRDLLELLAAQGGGR